MNDSISTLFLEINSINFIFYVGKKDENENFKIVYKLEIPISGPTSNRIFDLENSLNTIKKNVILIEQKFNESFKEIILILEDFDTSFINLSGFKKLNGYQVLRENITYILNSLKSYVNEIETKKTILHIFNSKFNLDNKRVDNLPIGLFGDFYSHELVFILINKNDYKNLNNILDKSNLKIKKILIKDFIKGATISEINKDVETFFHIKIEEKKSKIIYFENNCLKFEQVFNFGSDIIIKDISKVTSLEINNIKEIIKDLNIENQFSDEDFIETSSKRKIKKKLIYEIAFARAEEIFELLLIKNINLVYFKNNTNTVFLEIDKKSYFRGLEKIFQEILTINNTFDSRSLKIDSFDQNLIETANKLVHFGWKSEAIPVTAPRKSMIARFFAAIFE